MSSFSPNDPSNPFAAWMPPFMSAGALNPFAGMPGMHAGGQPDVAAWMKALDPAEIERRIGELKVVEMWLQTQASMVQMSIQTMTLQKQSMESLHSATKNMQAQSAAMADAAQSLAGAPAAAKPRAKKR